MLGQAAVAGPYAALAAKTSSCMQLQLVFIRRRSALAKSKCPRRKTSKSSRPALARGVYDFRQKVAVYCG